MRFQLGIATLAGAACLGVTSMAQAAFFFSYGQVTNTATNVFTLPLFVRSDVATSVRGAELVEVIGDGGAAAGGTTAAPSFVSVNLKPAGGLFGSSTETPSSIFSSPQTSDQSISLTSGNFVTVPVNSTLLATITLNTAGLAGKTFTISNNFGGSSSTFTASAAGSTAQNVTNLTQTITIPEPATLAALGLAGVAMIRRRTARQSMMK